MNLHTTHQTESYPPLINTLLQQGGRPSRQSRNRFNGFRMWAALLLFFTLHASRFTLHAQVPQMLNYQGRVAVGGTNFTGTGQFKFALVSSPGPDTSVQATAFANTGS